MLPERVDLTVSLLLYLARGGASLQAMKSVQRKCKRSGEPPFSIGRLVTGVSRRHHTTAKQPMLELTALARKYRAHEALCELARSAKVHTLRRRGKMRA